MDKRYFSRIFIYCVLYILVTLVVYLNNPFEEDNSSAILQVKYSNNMPSFNYYIETAFSETSENIFVLGAAARNASFSRLWNEYAVYGQMYRRSVPSGKLSCCLRYANGSIVKINITRDHQDWMANQRLGFLHVACPNPMGSYENSNTLPEDIALTYNVSCQR